MAKAKAEIIADLTSYIRNGGGRYSDWYVGIAADARDRLFNDHAVKEKGGAGWIYRECVDSAGARDVEDHFLALGANGGSGGGDDSTKYVYAYKKTSYTIE